MSDNIPTVLDQLQTAAPQTTTAGIADRTQELIDEVNRLLVGSQVSAPASNPSPPPAAESVQAVVKEATQAQPTASANPDITSFLSGLLSDAAQPAVASTSLAAEPPASVPAPAPPAPAPQASAAPAPPTPAPPTTAASVPAPQAVAPQTLAPQTVAPQAVAAPAPAPAPPTAINSAVPEAVTPTAEPTAQPEPETQAEPKSEAPNPFAATDLAALFRLPSENTDAQQSDAQLSDQTSASVTVPTAATELATQSAPVVETVSAEVAPYDVLDSLRPASNEEVTSEPSHVVGPQDIVEEDLTVHVETQTATFDDPQLDESQNGDFGTSDSADARDAMAFEESSSAVDELREFVEGDNAIEDLAAFGSDEIEEEVETVDAESTSSFTMSDTVEDTSESVANSEASEPQSYTEKYLAQFSASSDDDETPFPTPQVDAYSATAETPAEPAESTQANVATEPESVEMTVESWMAKNFGKPEEEENADEDEDETESTTSNESAPQPESKQPESKQPESSSDADVVAADARPPFAAAEVEANAVAAEAIFENQPQIEALVGKRLQELEIRIGQMFQSLSTQIESYSGVAAEPVALPVVQQPVASVANADNGGVEVDGAQPNAAEITLQQRLRKTEIELSISSAKVSQERNRLEQLQADLERREAAIAAQLQACGVGPGASPEDKKSGLMDRWKRHLG